MITIKSFLRIPIECSLRSGMSEEKKICFEEENFSLHVDFKEQKSNAQFSQSYIPTNSLLCREENFVTHKKIALEDVFG
jgi:hypothetical protein